jgi:hypothetical protein
MIKSELLSGVVPAGSAVYNTDCTLLDGLQG